MKLPVGMKDLKLPECKGVTGDFGQMHLPIGMENLDLGGCEGVTGKTKLN